MYTRRRQCNKRQRTLAWGDAKNSKEGDNLEKVLKSKWGFTKATGERGRTFWEGKGMNLEQSPVDQQTAGSLICGEVNRRKSKGRQRWDSEKVPARQSCLPFHLKGGDPAKAGEDQSD